MPDLRIDVSTEEATAELKVVLASPGFARSPRLSRLLTYLCTKFFAGQADQIKEYSIGVEVLDRPVSFDPANDAAARVEVHRLRRRLQQYYETPEGISRKLRIVIPVGHYVPAFVSNVTESRTPVASVPEPSDPPVELSLGLESEVLSTEPEQTSRPAVSRIWIVATALLALAAIVIVTQFSRKTARPGATQPRDFSPALLASIRQPVPVLPPPGNSVRIACGHGVSYTDRSGQTWGSDRYFDGGASFDSPRQVVLRAFDPKLYQNGRVGDFSYHIPLPKGVYEMRLGFAETTYGPGTAAGNGEYARTFDVKANGKLILDDFDIYSDANGNFVADTRVFKDISPGGDGILHLEFHSRRAPALINTIELVPAPPHHMNPIRIVAQENFVTGANGAVWSPDKYVSGGQLSNHSVQVANTDDPDLYVRERFGHFEYALPVDTGTYGLSLYFAEEYFGTANAGGKGVGARVFDVFCNGVALLRDFDILKEASPNRALVKTFHGLTPNAQGKLVVTFVPIRNYASLYALEVLDESQ